jgi:hypothetical protein
MNQESRRTTGAWQSLRRTCSGNEEAGEARAKLWRWRPSIFVRTTELLALSGFLSFKLNLFPAF